MIQRPYYLGLLAKLRDSPGLLKVLAGVRRCGKSSLLGLLGDHLVADGVPKDAILTLNFESMTLSHIDSAEALNNLIGAHDFPKGKRYIFLDEVQLVPGWERAVNSLRLDPRNDIYITGSNTRMLSSDLASLLSGRYILIEVFPLSFAEYVTFADHATGRSPAALLNDYLARGGLPGQFELRDDPTVWAQYVDGVLNTILTKDIVARHEVRDVDALMKIVRYLASNIGNLVTAKGIADYLGSTGRRVSPDTVDNYLGLLEEAYLFYRAKREDLRGKTIMKTNDKFYVVDLGIRALLQGLGTSDLGRALENIVYFELRRRHSKVSVGKHGSEEVDFVCFTPNRGIEYFQVCLTLQDESTRQRELRPLVAIHDTYPKTILSLDEVRAPDYEGIRHLNLIDWLLGG